jgi:GNAT superfamily N-acetyltransferase
MHPDQPPVTLRVIQAADEAQWRILWDAYHVFYVSTLAEEVTRSTWQRFLNPDEPVFAAVAVQGDQLLGFVHIVIHRSTWSVQNFCYLEDLFVAPDARATGIGHSLIAWARTYAQAHACSRLYWHTHHTNLRAQALYNKVADNAGFIEYRMDLPERT